MSSYHLILFVREDRFLRVGVESHRQIVSEPHFFSETLPMSLGLVKSTSFMSEARMVPALPSGVVFTWNSSSLIGFLVWYQAFHGCS